jgi:hypothetical protein
MPATRTITSLGATITQANLVSALQAAFLNAGFSNPVSDFTSGTDRIFTYSITTGSGTFGTIFLRVRVTSALAVFQQLFTAWNPATNTGTGNSTEVSYGTLSNSVSIVFNALNGGLEYGLILLTQGGTFQPLGLIAPLTKRSSFSFNSYTWGFIFTSATMAVVRGSSLNQYASADYDLALIGNSRLATANPIDNERDVISNLVLLTQSNQGFAGRTSDELAVVAASGSTRYDTISISGTSQQYLIVLPGAGGVAVRIF